MGKSRGGGLGGERVRHWIEGKIVLEYEKPMIGGGVANGYDPAIKQDGKAPVRATADSRPRANLSSSAMSGSSILQAAW